MTVRRAKRYGTILLYLAGISMMGWVIAAGPVTVYRTVAYNFSGIEDSRIFPRRILTAAPLSFQFREGIRPDSASFKVNVGRFKGVPLVNLLETSDTIAFLIIKDDVVVFENYDDGYDRTTPSLSFSMAKSVLSLLVGAALDDGYLQSVDQPVTDFIPELVAKGFTAVTLRHLLQMTSGIDYAENDFPFGIHVRFYYTDRLEDEILKLQLRETPGSQFVYKSGDTFLLTLALDRALGHKSITEYTQERIWNPLGMEHEGAWNIDHAPDGLEKTGCCLVATARDFAKFGRLYLNRGSWNGQRIISETWVTESVKLDTDAGSAWDYQYMWWLVSPDRADFMAVGHLGQFLYVNPTARVIIVRLGQSLGGLDREEWEALFILLSDSLR